MEQASKRMVLLMTSIDRYPHGSIRWVPVASQLDQHHLGRADRTQRSPGRSIDSWQQAGERASGMGWLSHNSGGARRHV